MLKPIPEIDIDFNPGFFKDSLYEVTVQSVPGNSAAQSEPEALQAKTGTSAPSLRPEAGIQAAGLGFSVGRFSSNSFGRRLDSGSKASSALNDGIGWPTL